jgi:hypothetical protein
VRTYDLFEKDFWNDDTVIKDLLFQSNLSNEEIAVEVGMTMPELKKRMKQLGLDWINKRKHKYSRGQESLYNLMQQLMPGERIEMEWTIDDAMRLDIYCPAYKLAAEYHGRQHFFYSDFFYDSRADFYAAKERDEKKAQWCRDNGITLVTFCFTDDLTRDIVFNRLLYAIKFSPVERVEERKKMNYNSDFYEKAKEKRREQNKLRYRKLKEYKRRDDDN